MKFMPLPTAIGSGLLLVCALLASASAAPLLPPVADPATGTHIPGKFIWFDLVTGDPAAARSFYGGVFGWGFESVRGAREDYTVIRNDGRAIGGVFRPALPRGRTAGTRWLSFAATADMERSIAAMTAGGATVLVPPTFVAGRGAHAVLRDSQQAIVGLMQSSSGDPADDPVGPGEFFWVDLYAREPAAAAKAYGELGFEIVRADEVGEDRLLLVAAGYARAGIMPLPTGAREPGWLPYVQVEDVAATLERARASGGKVLVEPDPAVLDSRVAVIADPMGGVIGVIHWPVSGEEESPP
jgi:predicted enzyme related to lactoylglutathione lyase